MNTVQNILLHRSSKCYDCCDGEATASCNANFADAYKAAADVDDIEGTEFENSWKLKTGKYWEIYSIQRIQKLWITFKNERNGYQLMLNPLKTKIIDRLIRLKDASSAE